VSDLRGKRIVLGSDVSSQALISEALARNGMKTKDVRIISGIGLDDPMKYEAVLKSGRVDVITA
jgi:ABC-type nitrate/sulfonate/bicarbonate transport system substrate-binding protein